MEDIKQNNPNLGFLIDGGNRYLTLVFDINIPGFKWIDQETWEYKNPKGYTQSEVKYKIGETVRGVDSPIFGVYDVTDREQLKKMVSCASHRSSEGRGMDSL